jgi:hypothetical protein
MDLARDSSTFGLIGPLPLTRGMLIDDARFAHERRHVAADPSP